MPSFTTSEGHRIHYTDRGAGKSIVLLHGWSGSSHQFVFTKRNLLKEGFRVIIPDLRGHGRSDTPSTPFLIEDLTKDLWELLRQLALPEYILLGYSMGVYVAFEFLLKYKPEQVSRLILVDMPPALVLAREEISHTLHSMRDDFENWWLRFYEEASQQEMTPKRKQMALNALKVTNPDILITLYEDMLHKDYREKLKSLTLPATLIYAQPGSLFASQDVQAMKAAMPQLELMAIEGATHFLLFTHPASFHQALLRCLPS